MQKIQRIHFEKLDSTITWIKSHYQEFDPGAITCVTASVQTAGRGRFSRTWVSNRGNLHMSLFFCLDKKDSRIPNLAQLMALAVCSLFPAKIKWPNDLVVDHKKLGGVLTELVDCETDYGVIQSLGLNVNAPVQTDQKTTSLVEWLGIEHDLDPLVDRIVTAFFERLEKGFSAKEYNAKLAFIGKRVRIGKLEGTLLKVSEEGQLLLELKSGQIVKISSGDLV